MNDDNNGEGKGARPIYRKSTNPYWQKIQDTQSRQMHLDTDTEKFSGRWREEFPGHDRLVVEIGCNGGHWLLGQAARDPKTLWVGLDYKFKQIYLAWEKAQKRGLKSNVVFLRANANRLPHIFGPGEVSKLCLFFPDPWPKDRHAKHRLFQAEWLRAIQPLIATTGHFEIRTDDPTYFNEMLEAIATVTDVFSATEVSHDLYVGRPEALTLAPPDVTLFERVFIQQGKPIHRMVLTPV